MRDYSLIGVEAQKALEMGLADAEWYQSPVPREQMRELLTRKNYPAIRDTIIWFGLIFASGYLIYLFWGAWYVIFPILIYSVLFATGADSRWHESSHGTAFKSDWMNNLLYEISSFMVLRQSTVWRWSHARHHSDTIIRGRDPEIAVPTPPDIRMIILGFFGIAQAKAEGKRLFKHAIGKIDKEVANYVPESEYGKVFFKARVYVLIISTVIFLAVFHQTVMPFFLFGIPTLIGTWLGPIYSLTQHAGLRENVLDHRLNCRTVYMNRINRFLYWNMNYHVEHHMFPLVPYHALPSLHDLMKDDCPPPYNGIIETYKEIIPTILKQVKDPSFYVDRELPKGAGTVGSSRVSNVEVRTGKLVNGKIEICHFNELPKGDVIRFDFEQKTYALYKTNSDRFYATDGICTHGNAHLAEGVVIGDIIECPKHNGRFDLKDGSPKRIPVCVGINTFKVEIINDIVYLDLKEVQGKDEELKKSFKVVSNKNVGIFIKELELEAVNGDAISYQPGQYIHLSIPPHKTSFSDFKIDKPYHKAWEDEKLFDSWSENTIYSKRNYSLATNPAKDSNLKFNIRIALSPDTNSITAGVGSSYVFNLKEGEQVKLTGPFGDFLIKNTDREMVYLGGGAGMAPIRSHLSYLFETQKTNRKVSFWYGARSLNDLFYEDYFEKFEKEHSNFSVNVALSEPAKDDKWDGEVGFIHEYLLNEYLSKHENIKEIEFYLCGPPAMIKASMGMLKKLGVSDKMIAFDEF
ncbi:NADH:ubiquinone reductase (Na(+)-transporting) subunit F [Labilibacter sediminis]|nr:NADH:ubiquinone reductase (Na(+)-transporting) subunit F [Labilibacter sediminis]